MDEEKEVVAVTLQMQQMQPPSFYKRISTLNEPPYIVVGIDFGTTYSGAAWAKSGTLDQVEVISQWSSQTIGATDSDKVPSEISYDAYNTAVKWGFGLKNSDNPLRWIKLLLSPLSLGAMNTTDSNIVEAARKQLRQYNKTPVDVISEYLRLLWNHILERLRIRLSAPVLDNMVLKVVLTIPAIWDHSAQTKMRLAAKKAGMLQHRPCGETTISLIAEPAAAALATYFDSEIKHNPIVQAGDSFVVCDAGGGTVDLISYTVKSFEPFRLVECIGATGDLCGAVYLDRAFLHLVKTLRSKHTMDKDAERRFMEREWELNVKRNFDGTHGPWPVELPQTQHNRKHSLKNVFKKEESSILTLTGDHLRQVFAEVVPKIVELLRDQVEGIKTKTGSRPKVIILVGGFGGNRYLLQQIERAFSPTIIIQQPVRSWSAVCRGAVHRGALGGDDIVQNHIAKYSYGITYNAKWEEGKFEKVDRWFDDRRQQVFARNQMQWYLRKHDDVEVVREVEHWFVLTIETPRELRGTAFTVWFSDQDEPGKRLTSHVRKLCKIKYDMSPFSFDSLPVFTNSLGDVYREVDCVLKMAVTVSSVNWSVVFRGKVLDVSVEYADTDSAAQVPT
ncbi:actin-like ATPase domain-containing protein [Acephala macrosclerotiorum]|nr:actin-like ATPase domain-containing protein [Acephala macrosclerotiorum]